jgi:aldehyde dehydrogenase (NAD+)
LTIISRSPHDPSDIVVETAAGDPVAAATAARTAQHDWSRRPAAERSAALTTAADRIAAAADELAGLIVREVGKPLAEATGEIARSVAILRYYSQQVFDPIGAVHEGPGLLFTRRRPRGVAGLITPWNFPLAIPLWKAAPALAFGNAVVIKPAPEATACALRLAELLDHLPTGLFSVVPGDAAEGQAIIDHADLVSFTGSTTAGRAVAAAAVGRGIPVQAEMGGQNAAIVLPDADLEVAAGQIAGAAMGYAGQKCTATKRVIAVGTDIRDALVAAVERLPVGDPASPATVAGPVIDSAARDRVIAAAAGGKVLTGGTALDHDGYYAAPTVVDEIPTDHVLAREEVFGPICAIQHADDIDEAVALANGVAAGLVAAVYTRDLDAALDIGSRLDTGMIKVNAPTAGVDFHLPFGGEKSSSYGPREQGKAAQDFYTSIHTITLAPAG